MKTLKSLLLELEQQVQPPVPNPSLGPVVGASEQGTIELPRLNLIVSIEEKQKKLTFSPIDPARVMPEAKSFIEQIKTKFKVTSVQQKLNNVSIVTLDPRQDISLVVTYLQQNAAI